MLSFQLKILLTNCLFYRNKFRIFSYNLKTKVMKHLLTLLTIVTLMSCSSVEDRIKEHSYTNEWHYIDTMRFQVYKTKSGRKYIIVLNNRQTNYKRQYIE